MHRLQPNNLDLNSNETTWFRFISTLLILLLVNMSKSILPIQPVEGYSGPASSAVRIALFSLRIIFC